MGAWGSGLFDNDGALTFIGEAEGGGIVPAATAIFDQLLAARGEYVEAPEGEEALAAAAAVAELVRPGQILPERLQERAARETGAVSDELRRKAIEVAEWLSIGPSETVEGWEDADPSDSGAWRTHVADVVARLKSQSP